MWSERQSPDLIRIVPSGSYRPVEMKRPARSVIASKLALAASRHSWGDEGLPRLTGFDEATIARWERTEIVPGDEHLRRLHSTI